MIVAIVVVALVAIGLIFSRLYKRSSKETSFVRTGLGGQRVVMNGGALVFPVLHETIPVNMNTLRLEVRRANEQALITKDRMRVDVLAEFYVRVQPTTEAIAAAAQTLGRRTMQHVALKELVEGKFVDALRAVAAEMEMEELHEQRVNFVQKVQKAVSEDLLKNGLELESVSLTGLDQTNKEFFNPNNAFDAAGLTKLTEEIEARRKRRNDIEQETIVQIEQKNLLAQQQRLEIERDSQYATLRQQSEIATRTASQKTEIAREEALRRREAEEATIQADQEVALARINADREIEESRIHKEQQVREKDIVRERSIEVAEQDKIIAIEEKSKQKAAAEAEADRARAEAVAAEEEVETVRETARSERAKAIELIEAAKGAERDAIVIKTKAAAEKAAAEDEAESIRIIAEARAAETRIAAVGDADAERARADAAERRYAVDAAGRAALNEADNRLSAEIVRMKTQLALIENLQDIIRESVKPMEAIDSIKILQVDGLNGPAGGAGTSNGGGSGADQIVESALRYRAQAPLIDSLLKELGIAEGNLGAMIKGASDAAGFTASEGNGATTIGEGDAPAVPARGNGPAAPRTPAARSKPAAKGGAS